MDRLVDHLFVFEGNGAIKDFPGNYSQYRVWKKQEENNSQNEDGKSSKSSIENQKPSDNSKVKFSYKERREFENLEKEIAELEKEKKSLEEKLGYSSTEFDELQKASERIGNIMQLLDEKEIRWLELSEKSGM
jgi:ATP-binding cassette subfamily F protein uup